MPTRALAILAYLVGVSGAGLTFAYVVGAGVGVWPEREAIDGPLPFLVNVLLLLLFAIQHSGMARQPFKTFIGRWIPADLERSTYVATSGIVLTLLVLFWQALPGKPIWQGPLWIVAMGLLAALGVGICCGWCDHATFLGLRPAPNARGPLRIDGPYRYVRHPLMAGLLIAIWAQPIMPRELLMMNVGFTMYIFMAIRWEERDLLREFGAEYEKYRRQVPALLPFRFFV